MNLLEHRSCTFIWTRAWERNCFSRGFSTKPEKGAMREICQMNNKVVENEYVSQWCLTLGEIQGWNHVDDDESWF